MAKDVEERCCGRARREKGEEVDEEGGWMRGWQAEGRAVEECPVLLYKYGKKWKIKKIVK